MDEKFEVISIIILFALLLCMMLGVNACSAPDWNNGHCPKCETRYELRGASKYYACPDCGKEVERY